MKREIAFASDVENKKNMNFTRGAFVFSQIISNLIFVAGYEGSNFTAEKGLDYEKLKSGIAIRYTSIGTSIITSLISNWWYEYFDFVGNEMLFSSQFMKKNDRLIINNLWGGTNTFVINNFGLSAETGVISTSGLSRYGLKFFYVINLNSEKTSFLNIGTRIASFDTLNSSSPGYLTKWRWTPDVSISYSFSSTKYGFATSLTIQSSYNKTFNFDEILFSNWTNRYYLLNVRYKESPNINDDIKTYKIIRELSEIYNEGDCINSHGMACTDKNNGYWWDYGTALDLMLYLSPSKWIMIYLTPFYNWTNISPGSNHRFGSGAGADFLIYGTQNSDISLSLNGIFSYHQDSDRFDKFSGGINFNLQILTY